MFEGEYLIVDRKKNILERYLFVREDGAFYIFFENVLKITLYVKKNIDIKEVFVRPEDIIVK